MHFVNSLPDNEEDCYELEHLEISRGAHHGLTDDDLAYVLPYCPHIETALLSGIPDLSDRTFVLLATTASSLRRVDVSYCTEVTDVAIFELAANAPRLESIKLNGVSGLADPSVSVLASSLSHLIDLELCELPLLTAASVRDIWTLCRTLRRLKLASCPKLTDKAFPHLAEADMETDYGPPSRPPTWLDALPLLILPRTHILSDLRLLDLGHCAHLTDAAVAGVLVHAPYISHLTLSSCTQLTNASASAIATLGTNLVVLALSRVPLLTDRGILAITQTCSRLRSVDVSFDTRLTDLAATELGALPHIRRLVLVGLPRLTDNTLLFLAEHAPELTRLHIAHCPALSLPGLHVALRKLPRLEHLGVSGVPALERAGVARFSEPPPEDYDERAVGIFRVFQGGNIARLRRFLDKEETRKREAERRCIIFVPREDDSDELY
ncbi:RNI-like protein [Obba rivulosa]|uniref:RNI-like protein n=1 Tax=Obba rivulosa TaxID=1052685 RepID=A0A8E2J4A3_9APHY|nr:RNI-like protein [Obba rivulosa]